MSSSKPSNNYPPELRERAIRMVAEVRGEYTSDWAAAQSVADKLGIGTPQTVLNWVRKAQVDAGQRPGVTSAEAAELRRLRADDQADPRRRDEEAGLQGQQPPLRAFRFFQAGVVSSCAD